MTSFTPTSAIKPPPIPSKHDIIPIHASDRGTFKLCRRKWDWTSPMRRNLQPRVDLHGIYFPLWFGSGVHYALSQYYRPGLQRDPVETFLWWYELQLKGGITRESDLDLSYDRRPKELEWNPEISQEPIYNVKGLLDLLPDPDMEQFELHRELGIGMLTYYKQYAEENDNFAVICEEHTFSIPITDASGEPLMAVDPRDGKIKEVHLRGTQDGILQDLNSGLYGILEHKSAISIDEDYHRKLDKDEQCTTYMYAAEMEAYIHGLEYERIDFTLYNALRKAYPKPPTELKSGLFSVDRNKESTTPAMLDQFIDERGIRDLVMETPKMLEYYNYVQEIGDKQFIERTPVRRNRAEIFSAGRRVFDEVMDMTTNPRIYPNPTGAWICLNCPFRVPCIAADDGSDYEMILTENYERNWSR